MVCVIYRRASHAAASLPLCFARINCTMVDVRGDVLRPPHGTTPAAVKSNIKSEMRSFKSNEIIHKKEGGSYYVVSANKASSVITRQRKPEET